MVETLASAIINYSGWDGKSALYDPFCGSGTLLCEAYLFASKTPASIFRKKFGFESLLDFNLSLWKNIKEDSLEKIKPIKKGSIAGSDISLDAVEASIANCKVIDEENLIKIENYDVFDIDKIDGSTIICNPPYGIRIGKPDELGDFYKKLGDFLKQRCKNSTAFIYFGDRKFIKKIGLKPAWKKPLSNGGLDGRLVKYELY